MEIIEKMIKDIEEYFSKIHFKVIEYTDNTITCERDDFDLRIYDYIEEEYNLNIECDLGFDTITIMW